MKNSFRCFALDLALGAVITSVSANASAAGAAGAASATIVTPVPASGTLEPFSTGVVISVADNLTIHLPGLSQSTTLNTHSNSVRFERELSDTVCSNAGALTNCFATESETGSLQGDPVHDILLIISNDGASGDGSAYLSLNYN